MMTHIARSEVQDDIKYLDLGFEEERKFFTFTMNSLGLSYTDQFPSDYKIAGFSIVRSLDSVEYDRSTYDLLACVGDIGGLEGAVLLFGGFLIQSFTGFLATVYLMPHIFYYRPAAQPEEVGQY
jgi:hypothetical protein